MGRKHLMLTVPMFVAAMAYNIWYFTQSGSSTTPVAPQEAVPGMSSVQTPSGPSVAGAEPVVDPMQIPAAPDVELDRLPAWDRNPFVGQTAPASAGASLAVASAAAQPDAPPDIVVSAIVIADRPRARVNGRNVYVGDRVGASTIVEILPRAIVVESPREGRRTIRQQGRSAAPVAPAGPAETVRP